MLIIFVLIMLIVFITIIIIIRFTIGLTASDAVVRLTHTTLAVLAPDLAHNGPGHCADVLVTLVQHPATVVGDGGATLTDLLQHVLTDVVRFEQLGCGFYCSCSCCF
uniref:Putative secreted protein n=1 Tax=Anopheles darlingi TaxID=43151 RepID=A0A2M4D203_ANODA